MYVYIYIYTYIHKYIYIYIYTHTQESCTPASSRAREKGPRGAGTHTNYEHFYSAKLYPDQFEALINFIYIKL